MGVDASSSIDNAPVQQPAAEKSVLGTPAVKKKLEDRANATTNKNIAAMLREAAKNIGRKSLKEVITGIAPVKGPNYFPQSEGPATEKDIQGIIKTTRPERGVADSTSQEPTSLDGARQARDAKDALKNPNIPAGERTA